MSAQLPGKIGVTQPAVFEGDCLALIPKLPDASIDVVVTSPPYWGQRESMGNGTEEDPREYIAFLQAVFAALLPKLKLQGIVWLNLGDAYNTPVNWGVKDYKYSSLGADRNGFSPDNAAYTKPRFKRKAFVDKTTGWLQYGNLLMLPQRLLLSLTESGYLYRGEVIWAKKNPMPEGRCRRPHRKHESIYLLHDKSNILSELRRQYPAFGSLRTNISTACNIGRVSPLNCPDVALKPMDNKEAASLCWIRSPVPGQRDWQRCNSAVLTSGLKLTLNRLLSRGIGCQRLVCKAACTLTGQAPVQSGNQKLRKTVVWISKIAYEYPGDCVAIVRRWHRILVVGKTGRKVAMFLKIPSLVTYLLIAAVSKLTTIYRMIRGKTLGIHCPKR